MKMFLKVTSFALLLQSTANAFAPHTFVSARTTKTELRDFLGEKLYAAGCISIFTDGTSLDFQCYPSPSSMPLLAHPKEQEATKAPEQKDCEIPYYDGSGEVLCWV